MSFVKHLDDSNFDSEALQPGKPVLVDFHAEWCGPCKGLAPVIEQIASERQETLTVVKVDVDQAKETAEKYGIRSMPTLMMLRDGKIIGQIIGAKPKQALESWIDESLAKPMTEALLPAEAVKKAKAEKAKDDIQFIAKILPKIASPIVYGVSALRMLGAIGGVIAAATATAPLGVAIGLGAMTGSLLKIYGGFMIKDTVHELISKALDKDRLDKADKTIAKTIKIPAVVKYSSHPVARLGFAGLTVAAGIAIWPVGGFFVGALSVLMVVSGSGGALSALPALAKVALGKKATITVTPKAKADTTLSASVDPAPTKGLDPQATAKDAFDASAPKQEGNAPAEQPIVKKDDTPKPPAAS